MTEPGVSQPLRRPRRRWGCLIGGVALVIPLAVVAYAWLLALSFQECNPSRTIRDAVPVASAPIDAAHPVIEQAVHVELAAGAIPRSAQPGAATVQVRAVDPTRVVPQPTTSRPPGGAIPAARVTFLDARSGQVLANQLRGEANELSMDPRAPVELALDCVPGAACVADVRVVIALVDPASAVEPVTIAWETAVEVAFGFVDCKGPSYDAASISAQAPTRLASADWATDDPQSTHVAGTIVAQHVSVTSPVAPVAGWLRATIDRPASTWLPWLAVLPDDGGPAVFDRIVDRPFSGGSATVDLPVLTSCDSRPCRQGYWILIRGVPLSGPYDTSWAPAEGFGQANLTLVGSALGRTGGDGLPVAIRVELDSRPIELAGDVRPATAKLGTALAENQPLAFDVDLHAEPAAPSSARPDPYRSALVIVRVFAPASGLGARLQGDGASSLVGAVGGFSSLAAVPFASCQPGVACEAHLRIVAEYAPGGGGRIIQPTPGIDAQVYVLGAPGVMATVSGPVDAPGAGASGAVPGRLDWPLVVAALLVLLGLAVAVAARRSRRRRGKAPG